MNIKVAKLFRQLMALGKVETDNGILIYEGDVLTEGTEVFIEDESGNIVPAPDGKYSDYIVKDGKIAPSEEPAEPEEKPAEEPVAEEEVPAEEPAEAPAEPEAEPESNYEERISALEAKIAELEAKIAELVSAKEDMEFSSLKPAEKEIKDMATSKSKGALKYFEK